METLLQRFNIDRRTLSSAEIETLNKWSQSLSQKTLGIPEVAEYITSMISNIERELHGYETPKSFTGFLFRKTRNKHLSARLENYIMLRDFLQAPERAKKFVETQLLSLSKN